MSNENDFFNLQALHDSFAASLLDSEDVNMDNYILAYKEIYRFFQLMGTIFNFVGTDVKDKIGILEEFRKGNEASNFTTFQTMINYERDNKLLDKKGYVSGSRTLLRLHRGLAFIILFLKRVGELKPDDKTANICQESYNSTLAKFHPWIIRKPAVLAMYSLPTRDVLLMKVCGSQEAIEAAAEILPKMVQVAEEVSSRTEELYTKHDLHGLP